MTKFTSENLLLFLFKECTPEQDKLIRQSLAESHELSLELENLKAGIEEWQSLEYVPHPHAVKQVLERLHEETSFVQG